MFYRLKVPLVDRRFALLIDVVAFSPRVVQRFELDTSTQKLYHKRRRNEIFERRAPAGIPFNVVVWGIFEFLK